MKICVWLQDIGIHSSWVSPSPSYMLDLHIKRKYYHNWMKGCLFWKEVWWLKRMEEKGCQISRGRQVHSLMLHCTSWAVLLSKAPEITLGMLLGSLMAYDPLLRYDCCLCLIVEPVVPLRKNEYPQACVWMWMTQRLGDFYTWGNCVKKEINMIKKYCHTLQDLLVTDFPPYLVQNPAC